jgi:hypothetical protein
MKRTARGFAMYAEFKDFDGENVKVQRSSAMGRRLVYIFPAAKFHLGDIVCGAHLTVPMAKRVIRALQMFIDGKE